jgi:hypothetical protein
MFDKILFKAKRASDYDAHITGLGPWQRLSSNLTAPKFRRGPMAGNADPFRNRAH